MGDVQRMGYSERFRLFYTDFETQQRLPKASARWFSQLATNSLPLPAPFFHEARGGDESCKSLQSQVEPGDAWRRQVTGASAAVLCIASLALSLTFTLSRRWRHFS